MTSWIPGFGGKSKEEKQADEAKAWHESHLGTGDEFFTHTRSAVEDSGSFKLTDVRPRPKHADRGGSRLVKIPKGKYEKPPQVTTLNPMYPDRLTDCSHAGSQRS